MNLNIYEILNYIDGLGHRLYITKQYIIPAKDREMDGKAITARFGEATSPEHEGEKMVRGEKENQGISSSDFSN